MTVLSVTCLPASSENIQEVGDIDSIYSMKVLDRAWLSADCKNGDLVGGV